MKREYLDIVVCKHDGCDKPFLFAAPAWSYLRAGAEVIVDTSNGKQKAKVVEVRLLYNDPDDQEVKFLLSATGATWPLKRVVSQIITTDLDWSTYEENETENLENEMEE